MDALRGKKTGSHLNLNPGGIKCFMNHVGAAESCIIMKTGSAVVVGGGGGLKPVLCL